MLIGLGIDTRLRTRTIEMEAGSETGLGFQKQEFRKG